jgi:hypothetical protein
MVKKTKKSKRTRDKRNEGTKPKCGLCGKKEELTKTECCDQWVCDDEGKYILFSYERNSCYRNHRRYTLCGYHHAEEHSGSWKDCSDCRADFETEMEIYVYYGTNEYNFIKLDNPPSYEPTKCSECGTVIVLSEGGYSSRGDEYWCEKCTDANIQNMFPLN